MTQLHLKAASDQRIAVLGQTRMGKTFMVEHLVEQQPRYIVVDSKHRVQWKGAHLTDNPIAALMTDRVIYRPDGGKPPQHWWAEAVQSLHERGGGVLVVDEMSFVTGPGVIDKGLADAFRLGGELGVGVWFCGQESTTIHNTTLRQAEMIVLFYNQGASDRDKLARIVGDMAYTTAHLQPFDFIVFVRGETYDHDAIPVYRIEP